MGASATKEEAVKKTKPQAGRCYICNAPDGDVFRPVCSKCSAEICPECVVQGQYTACPSCGDEENDWASVLVVSSTVLRFRHVRNWVSGRPSKSPVGNEHDMNLFWESCCSCNLTHSRPARLAVGTKAPAPMMPHKAVTVDSLQSLKIPELPYGNQRESMVQEVVHWLEKEMSGGFLDEPEVEPREGKAGHPALAALDNYHSDRDSSSQCEELQDGGFKPSSVVLPVHSTQGRASTAKADAARLIEATKAANREKARKLAEELLLLEAQIKSEERQARPTEANSDFVDFVHETFPDWVIECLPKACSATKVQPSLVALPVAPVDPATSEVDAAGVEGTTTKGAASSSDVPDSVTSASRDSSPEKQASSSAAAELKQKAAARAAKARAKKGQTSIGEASVMTVNQTASTTGALLGSLVKQTPSKSKSPPKRRLSTVSDRSEGPEDQSVVGSAAPSSRVKEDESVIGSSEASVELPKSAKSSSELPNQPKSVRSKATSNSAKQRAPQPQSSSEASVIE